MLKQIFSCSFIFNFIGFISCLFIDINIYPKSIQPGNDLQVTCNVIFQDPSENKLKTLLRCPFYDKEELCIVDCDSQESCTADLCDRKVVRGQRFNCDVKETVTSLSYSYTFPSLSNLVIKDRKQLPFKCSYKGISASGFVNISNSAGDKIPSRTNEDYRPIMTNSHEIIRKTDTNHQTGFLKSNDLILVGLLVLLFVSVGINFWCTIKWCIRCCKKRFHSSNFHLHQMSQNQPNTMENINFDNKIVPPYYAYDHMKRAISQPALSNPDKNTTQTFVSNNNTNQFNSAAAIYKPKFKSSLQTFDEYDLNNGSERSIINPLYGQMVLAPIQCLDPTMFPYLSPLSKAYSQQIHVNTDIDQVQNNMEIFVEDETPHKRRESISRLLPEKPD